MRDLGCCEVLLLTDLQLGGIYAATDAIVRAGNRAIPAHRRWIQLERRLESFYRKENAECAGIFFAWQRDLIRWWWARRKFSASQAAYAKAHASGNADVIAPAVPACFPAARNRFVQNADHARAPSFGWIGGGRLAEENFGDLRGRKFCRGGGREKRRENLCAPGSRGVLDLRVSNRTPARAESWRGAGGIALPFATWARAMPRDRILFHQLPRKCIWSPPVVVPILRDRADRPFLSSILPCHAMSAPEDERTGRGVSVRH